jgi:hypothetical protein
MAQALTAEPPVTYADGWLKYDIPDSPFFINASPKGTSFHVLEAGACPRGMAWTHGKRGSLSAALKFAATLKPSTTADILDRVAEGLTSDIDLDRIARLRATGEPGTRLWSLPTYTADGYHGLGEAATSLGLAVIGVEALFGTPGSCWTVRYRTDSGEEPTAGGWSLLTLADARERWWILSHDGHDLVSGGHARRANMERHARDYPGSKVVQGCMFIREDGSVFTTLVSLADHLDGV